MKHFIAIHRFHSLEKQREYCMTPENKNPPESKRTVRQWADFANNTKENVKCRSQFVGDDISFCHWEAESKQSILEWFDELGLHEFMTIELHEQWRFHSVYDQSDQEVVYKDY